MRSAFLRPTDLTSSNAAWRTPHAVLVLRQHRLSSRPRLTYSGVLDMEALRDLSQRVMSADPKGTYHEPLDLLPAQGRCVAKNFGSAV